MKDTNGILKLQENFYRSLYTKDPHISFEWSSLSNENNPKVPEEMKKQHECPFTTREMGIAIKQLLNNKTCGNDGIPIDFYKVFWSLLCEPFSELVEQIFTDRKCNPSALIGIINLIPKQSKNTKFLQSLRPITLLNSDYKSLEKMIANRIESALEIIINCDQRGFMKNRRICTNIRLMYELITRAEHNNLSAVILSLDLLKCFDRIEFDAITGAMHYFGFSEYLITWTNILYTDFKVSTQNNGYFSNRISVGRGLHQGGPCSSLYFLVVAEIMAIMMRENTEIKGIMIDDILNLLGQYADDAHVYSIYEQKSLDNIFVTSNVRISNKL